MFIGLLRLYFRRWHSARDEALLYRLTYERAVTRFNNGALRTAWNKWRQHVVICRRKLLLQRQSVWFHDTGVVATCFVRWRSALSVRRHEQMQTCTALWHWSLSVQRKVIHHCLTFQV